MADAVYAVVDKSKKGKKLSLPQNEIAESTPPNCFDCPVYDVTDHSADTPPVPKKDEAFNSEYSMISLDNMYSKNTRPREVVQGRESTTSVMTTKSKKVLNKKSLKDENKGCKIFICVFITIAVVATTTLICLAILFAEVLKLKAQTTSMQQPFINQQAEIVSNDFSSMIQQLNKTLGHDIQQLNGSIEMVQQEQETSTHELIQKLDNHIQQLNNSIGMVILDQEMSNNTIWELLAQVRQDIEDANQPRLDQIGQSQAIPAPSCASLIALTPSSPSDYYWVRASNGSAVRVYCDMTRSCGGVTGGWMRVAELNMTNSCHQCPGELMQQTTTSRRTCRMTSDAAGCSPDITYSTISEYSKVCGKIRGFQTGTPDSFDNSNVGLERNYVDGVSLTHGQPRQHIWTFAAYSRNRRCFCNRSTINIRSPPLFVSTDYFCDTGTRGSLNNIALWEKARCYTYTCCPFNNPPWFYRELPRPSTDNIDMRVCRDQERGDEDIQIQVIQIYVQ